MAKVAYPISLCILGLLLSCSSTHQGIDTSSKSGSIKGKWKLVWEDDFSKDGLNPDKWSKIPPNKADWGKHLSDHPDCYTFADGHLSLWGINNPDLKTDPRLFLTGGIHSKGKFAFRYGKVLIRAKLFSAQGAWPAMWLLPEKETYGAYPKNGEIDLMEHLNYDSIIYQTVHSFYTLEMHHTEKPRSASTTPFDREAFHTFGIEWTPRKLRFSLDGKTTFVYPRIKKEGVLQWPFDQPFYLLITQQLGGKWAGPVYADDLPVEMVVDFVKVYQK